MNPISILAFFTSNLWRTAFFAAVLAVGFQTAQIEGIHLWPLSIDGYRGKLAACEHRATVYQQQVAIASETARADAEAAARKTEQRNAKITEEKQRELESQLAAYRGVAARYASLHRPAQADPGLPGQAHLPGVADPASGPPAPVALAVVPDADLDACAVNAVVAQGWQDWWQKVSQPQPDAAGLNGSKPAG